MGMWQHVATLRQRIIEERRLLEKEENEIYRAEKRIRGILLANTRHYQCSRCGKRYKHSHILRRHLDYECGVEPKFRCGICGKMSKRNKSCKCFDIIYRKRSALPGDLLIVEYRHGIYGEICAMWGQLRPGNVRQTINDISA
ncbi:unnamed protein product [Acanthoscelides obtectus]|uniref:C2H2-type domain-containing protein n=1 Tax=Acanthoscelides obtectus TaxID=200917 RepID=A0A9P0P3S0_ACAOB|nr:unnamed protein product [Acanthoscelides obtectus]CAK1669713.1 Longitudinals lacking protein, isoforms N/O/W/X/Y [Acanthoscelides obtectus]